ncbi:MAG: hypothetical protein Q9M31_10135 [Mariprofundus sp.]|nr:hypothetical protein [Mariprofundus sp.]
MVYLKQILKVSLAIICFIAFIVPAQAASHPKKGNALQITIEQALLKSSPRAFGSKILKKLNRGSKVIYQGKTGIYYQVKAGKQSGYITTKAVLVQDTFSSFSRSDKVSQSDMAAATKGFSPEVEKQNRKNKQLRYDRMDQAEKSSTIASTSRSLSTFRKTGKLGEFQ